MDKIPVLEEADFPHHNIIVKLHRITGSLLQEKDRKQEEGIKAKRNPDSNGHCPISPGGAHRYLVYQ